MAEPKIIVTPTPQPPVSTSLLHALHGVGRITTLRTADRHWSSDVAQQVVERFPHLDTYTCAAGISPSGIVHFGNFRDVMTSHLVLQELRALGKNTRLIFSWDNFDRFRKLPAGIDPSFAQHIGKPLSKIPDPSGKYPSYAKKFQTGFEEALQRLDIDVEYRDQTQLYESGLYDQDIIKALHARSSIAAILLSSMSDKAKREKGIVEDKFIAEYYPVSVYSRFTGKDSTRVLSFDGERHLTYRCLETKEEETIDITKTRIAKLAWKIDWPMRWAKEGVIFEPGGHDHASPGGSYDVSQRIANEVFGYMAPLFLGYEFIGLRGLSTKMSGSKGDVVSPSDLLKIYQPAMLRWLYTRARPDQAFELAFDSETIRQYEEFDREVAEGAAGKASPASIKTLSLSFNGAPLSHQKPISFRQAVALGQIVQWDTARVIQAAQGIKLDFDPASVPGRLDCARNWLEIYNPEQLISLRETRNDTYFATMSAEARGQVKKLHEALGSGVNEVEALDTLVYGIPKNPALDGKQNGPLQRAFFKDVYQLLVGNDTGPRLSTFLWAIDRQKALQLLSFE